MRVEPFPTRTVVAFSGSYWRLDEATGTIVDDSSGFGNIGAISGTVTQGVQSLVNDSDTATLFGGGGVQLPTSDSLTFGATDSFSVEAWIQTTSDDTGMITSQQQCGASAIQLYISSGTAVFRIYGPSGSEVHAYADFPISDGNPHHLVGVRDVAAHKVLLYVDGQLFDQPADLTQGALTVLPIQTWIGERYWCGSTNPFSGSLTKWPCIGRRWGRTCAGALSSWYASTPSAWSRVELGLWPGRGWRPADRLLAADDPSGTRVQDATGHSYIGFSSGNVGGGQTLLIGDDDAARQFTGGGILVPSRDGLSFGSTDSFTVEAWTKTTSTATQMVFAQQQCTDEVVILGNTGGAAYVQVRDGSGAMSFSMGGSVAGW